MSSGRACDLRGGNMPLVLLRLGIARLMFRCCEFPECLTTNSVLNKLAQLSDDAENLGMAITDNIY